MSILPWLFGSKKPATATTSAPATAPVTKSRVSANLSLHSLRALGLNSALTKIAQDWILLMTPQEDGEDGQAFWRWIIDNNNMDSMGGLCDTYFLTDDAINTVVATFSIVKDDREMGAKYGIEGVWLGGVNVNKNFRGRGIGRRLLGLINDKLHVISEQSKRNIKVNLFTSNNIAMHMYEAAGYLPVATLVDDVDNIPKRYFTKNFQFITREKDQVIRFLNELNTRALTYHNQKENSAWAAIAFYYLLAFGWIIPLSVNGAIFGNWGVKLFAFSFACWATAELYIYTFQLNSI